MTASRLEYLFNKHVQEDYTEQEKAEFFSLLAKPENEAALKRLIDAHIANANTELQMPEEAAERVLENIFQKAETAEATSIKRRNTTFRWMQVAAAVIIIVCAYWFTNTQKQDVNVVSEVAPKITPVMPGGNKALLTIAGGKTLVLDSIPNGALDDTTMNVNKQQGLLIYNGSTTSHSNSVVYNTLSTPRGGQYSVRLPDGSKVWLNAESSLRFPTAFTGTQRQVDLTGEAYFEVAKSKEQPFIVKVNGMQVEVLGTHFNVNAYTNEKYIRTSLLEGSVKVASGQNVNLLVPGQQAIHDPIRDRIRVKAADMEEVVAWKNGRFHFDDQDILAIMRQISRWYAVDVVFAGKITERRFSGKISRDAQLEDVLKILELSNVKFKVDGKKIEVL